MNNRRSAGKWESLDGGVKPLRDTRPFTELSVTTFCGQRGAYPAVVVEVLARAGEHPSSRLLFGRLDAEVAFGNLT